MEFETLKKNHKKEIKIGVSIIILIGVVLIVKSTFAKYELVKNIKIAEGTINYKVPDFKTIAMYKNDGSGDIEIDTMPTSGYAINEEKSYCTIDNLNKDSKAKLYTDEEGNHVISGLSKNSKCYLYFDNYKKVNTALGEITVKLATPDFSKTSCSEGCGESTVGIYQAKDDDGWSYYYRGDVENNYVKFGEFYWRIIRINGDGTIRMIYNGPTPDQTGESTQIGTSSFAKGSYSNETVGFKYTMGEAHGLETKSAILEELDKWYANNLTSYTDKIDTNAGFCGDRTSTKGDVTGQTSTQYGAVVRLIDSKAPDLKCPNTLDLYTLSDSIKGNKSLTYPIGLITADEVSLAGGLAYEVPNQKFYLQTGQTYWTISPCDAYKASKFYSGNLVVHSEYSLSGATGIGIKLGVRPVINLRLDTSFSFTGIGEKGSITNPYIVNDSN